MNNYPESVIFSPLIKFLILKSSEQSVGVQSSGGSLVKWTVRRGLTGRSKGTKVEGHV